MSPGQIDEKYSLAKIEGEIAKRLLNNEYIQNVIGAHKDNFQDIEVAAKWKHDKNFGAQAHLTVTFLCNADQFEVVSNSCSDEDEADSIDSGCEDEFREAFKAQFGEPKFEWGYGGTKLKAKKTK